MVPTYQNNQKINSSNFFKKELFSIHRSMSDKPNFVHISLFLFKKLNDVWQKTIRTLIVWFH